MNRTVKSVFCCFCSNMLKLYSCTYEQTEWNRTSPQVWKKPQECILLMCHATLTYIPVYFTSFIFITWRKKWNVKKCIINSFVIHGRTVSYVDDFLSELKHLHNHILVKTYLASVSYGSILKIKIYRRINGQWERFSNHITRVKSKIDLDILHGTLQNYQTMLQYMYDNTNESDSE